MNDEEIKILKNALETNEVIWHPDSETAHSVLCISTHAEEGAGLLCAIFSHGKFASLYNADLSDFYSIKPLKEKDW